MVDTQNHVSANTDLACGFSFVVVMPVIGSKGVAVAESEAIDDWYNNWVARQEDCADYANEQYKY